METNNSEVSRELRLEHLRSLEIERLRAAHPKDWPESKRQELLNLQKSLFGEPFNITQEHKDALRRQYIAETGDNPPLTDKERELIREANSAK